MAEAPLWKRLHKLVYLIIVLVIIHYLWLVKADYLEPMIYGFLGAGLLLARLIKFRRPAATQSSVLPSQ